MTITRRTTLAVLAASPFTIASVAALTVPGGEGQTILENTYQQWLSAQNDIEETLALLPHQLTKSMEQDVLEPLYRRADALEDAIIVASVTGPGDLAVKVLVVLATPEALDEDAVDRIKADAMLLVNLSGIS